MNRILSLVQSQAGPWVGLSVVHLGDRDVPNGELTMKIIVDDDDDDDDSVGDDDEAAHQLF